MDIKDSAVLKDKTMQRVKRSLENVSSIDNKDGFRVDMLEYINQSSYNNNDMFFYDMMEFIRFLKPGDESVAYTTPDHLIYLNAPGQIGEKVRQWDFVYDHECMHQLWDTFGVEDKIKEELGSCDSMLLNIASDCVINDYLEHYRKKEMPNDLITPDLLETKYGVVYDRKIDTQYTLYKKLLEVQDKLMKDLEDLLKKLGNQQQGNDSSNNSSGQGSGSSQKSSEKGGKGNPGKGQSGQKSDGSDEGNKDMDDVDGDNGGSSSGKDKNGKNGKGGRDKDSGEGDGDEESNENGSGKDGDEESEGKSGKKSKDSGDNGEESEGDGEGDEKDSKNGKSDKSSPAAGDAEGSKDQFDEDLAKIRKDAEDIINSYAKKISGVFGEFVKKCKSSRKCDSSGLEVKVQKGNATWNQEMSHYINAYVKNKIFKKKRQWTSTYSRVRRGSGPVKFGQPIFPGRKIIEETMDINCAFYVDKSGSMCDCIQDVYNAVYRLAEAMKKQFSREQVVNKVDFNIFAFDTSLMKVKYGNSTNADGGTMSFEELLDNINKRTKDYMINVIITDAGFSGVNEGEVEKFIDGLGGILLFITNVNNDQVKNIAKKKSDKLCYILADANFTVGA